MPGCSANLDFPPIWAARAHEHVTYVAPRPRLPAIHHDVALTAVAIGIQGRSVTLTPLSGAASLPASSGQGRKLGSSPR